MQKLITLALSLGHGITISKDQDFTIIKVSTENGYFKHNGFNIITCSYYPEDERDEINQLIEKLYLGLYQYN